MKRLPKLLALPLILLLLLPLAGCWQEEAPSGEEMPSPPQDLDGQQDPAPEKNAAALPERFSLPYMPGRTLDPLTCADGMQQTVASLLYEGLFQLDHSFTPHPCLCQSYSYDPETRRYVFTLQSGVLFSDGSPLTGADVRASLDRARTSERYGSRLSGVVSISAAQDSVTITLSAPNSGFPALLDIPIVKNGSQTLTAPIGTGPYLYEEAGALLVANQSWWRGDGQPVDRITLVEASSGEAMLYRFSSHDVQLITADLTGPASVSTTGSADCLDTGTTVMQYLGCNVQREPLNNAALRRALWTGLNRPYLVSAFLSGHGAAAQFPVSPASPLYPDDLETAYSLDAFTAALAASGYTAARPLELLVNAENSFKCSIAAYLAEFFTASGLPLTVRVLPWEEYTAALAAGDFDLYYGEIRLTADWNLSSLLDPGGALNYGGWSHPQTNQLMTDLAAAGDRAAAMKALCAHLQAQAPILPLCFKAHSVLSQPDVLEGLNSTAAEPFYQLENLRIHLGEP